MLNNLEPLVVMTYGIAGTEEVVDLFVGEFVFEDSVKHDVVSFVSEFKPTWVVEELVEIFEVVFGYRNAFLGKKEGIDRCMEFLFEEIGGGEDGFGVEFGWVWVALVLAVLISLVGLSVEFVEDVNDILFAEVVDDVLNTVNEDSAHSVFVLFLSEGPDVAFLITNVDGDILPGIWGGNRLIVCDNVADKAINKESVLGVFK